MSWYMVHGTMCGLVHDYMCMASTVALGLAKAHGQHGLDDKGLRANVPLLVAEQTSAWR